MRSRILSDEEMAAVDREADAMNDVVFVVLRGATLVGVYSSEEIAIEAAGGQREWVIPCDVLDEAP